MFNQEKVFIDYENPICNHVASCRRSEYCDVTIVGKSLAWEEKIVGAATIVADSRV